ncbi:MAG: hypothetical protein E7354_02780 [Clostridiales bacterium]|nr:hypothetical protein [Clostridiales bacterium]
MGNKALAISTAILGASSLVFMSLFILFCVSSNTYKNQLENNYNKSFYEVVSNINDLEVDMSKIVATTSLDSQRELLTNINQTSLLAVSNLSNLPLNWNGVSGLNNILNTTSGFSYSLLLDNYDGNVISKDDFSQMSDLHTRIREIQYDLNSYLSGLNFDYSILDEVDFDDMEGSLYSAGLINTESSKTEVPSLIYDGPFSDTTLNKEIRGLEDREYTLEEIEEKLHAIFSGFAIYYIGDSNGKFTTYNFDIKGNIDLYVSVTKKGAHLLTITSYGTGKGNQLSLDEGIALAENFAKDVGLENMYEVWHQHSGNILYVNLAPIKNKVIYYSDLVKVKVDLSLGLVVGWESSAYATNHTDRNFTSSVGMIDAMNTLSPELNIVERNYCIIPDKFVGEISAFEFICKWKDYTYYIYIDSNTGKEVNILRVIKTSNGDLLE